MSYSWMQSSAWRVTHIMFQVASWYWYSCVYAYSEIKKYVLQRISLLTSDKLHRRDLQLSSLLKYIKETQTAKLHGYTGEDVDLILRMLRDEPSRDGLNRTSNLTTIQDRNRHSMSINRTQGKGSGAVAESAIKRDSYTSAMADFHLVEQGEHDLLHEVAHGLHFASIALLGFLVIEVRMS